MSSIDMKQLIEWCKGDHYNMVKGIRDSLLLLICFSVVISILIILGSLLGYDAEQIWLETHSCEQILFDINNGHDDTQIRHYYSDNCIRGK